jgi:hypothetical protein
VVPLVELKVAVGVVQAKTILTSGRCASTNSALQDTSILDS